MLQQQKSILKSSNSEMQNIFLDASGILFHPYLCARLDVKQNLYNSVAWK